MSVPELLRVQVIQIPWKLVDSTVKNILFLAKMFANMNLDKHFVFSTQSTHPFKLYLVNTIECSGYENPRDRI